MRFGLALGLVLAGCYAPQPHAGAPCPDGVCPTGLVCSPATMTCETRAIDAGSHNDTSIDIDARPIDGGIDARPIDGKPPNVPMLVQQKTSFQNTNTTLSVTLNAAPTNGNILIFVGATISGEVTISGGGVTTWKLATQSLSNANEEIYYGLTDGSSSTITISRVDTATAIWMHVSEWSGLAAGSSLLDDASSNNGLASPASAGTITTTAPALLVFGATDFTPNTFGTPTPGTWTALTPIATTQTQQSAWYRIEPTPGAYTPTVTETEHEWEAAHAAFHYIP